MDKIFKKPIKRYKILDDRNVTSKCPILRVHNTVFLGGIVNSVGGGSIEYS